MPRSTNVPLTPPRATTTAAAMAGGLPQRSSAAAASGSGDAGYAHSQYEPPRTLILEQQQRFQQNVLNAREGAGGGSSTAAHPKTASYIAHQKEYMRWFGAKSGILRGVALNDKVPLTFPVVSRNWAAVFLEEVYCYGFQWRTGRVVHHNMHGDICWWKTFYDDQCGSWPRSSG